MQKVYLCYVLVLFSIAAQAQTKKAGTEDITSITQSHAKFDNSLIPVHVGDVIAFRTELFSVNKTKRPLLSTFLKTLGFATATYQTGKLIEGTTKPSKDVSNTGKLLPLGATLYLSADMLAKKNDFSFSIKYTKYNIDMQEEFSEIIKVDKKFLKAKERPYYKIEKDGFLKVDLFQSGKELESIHIYDILHGHEDLPVIDQIDQFDTYYENHISLDRAEIVKSRNQGIDLKPQIPGYLENRLKLSVADYESNKISNRRDLIYSITPKSENGNEEVNFGGDDSKPIVATPVPSKKQEPLPSKKLPIKSRNLLFAIPLYRQRIRRSWFQHNDDINDDGINSGSNPPVSGDDQVRVNSVPGVNGVGYGSGGNAIVYSTPHYANPQIGITYSGSGGNQGGWDDSGNHFNPANPCDEYDPNSPCYDYCAVNPDDYICCDITDPESWCYDPCMSASPAPGELEVDARSYANFLNGVIPSNATSKSVFLSSYTDSWGIKHYQLSGAYTDANSNVTTFSKFNIGNSVPDYDSWVFNTINFPWFPYSPVGDPISYSGGCVQNYQDAYGSKYVTWTDNITGQTTVFPGISVSPSGTTQGAAYTLPDDPGNPYSQIVSASIHIDQYQNGLDTLQHEYGHFLSYMVLGRDYVNIIMLSSFFAATFSAPTQKSSWTETLANSLSSQFFGSKYAPSPNRYPICKCQ